MVLDNCIWHCNPSVPRVVQSDSTAKAPHSHRDSCQACDAFLLFGLNHTFQGCNFASYLVFTECASHQKASNGTGLVPQQLHQAGQQIAVATSAFPLQSIIFRVGVENLEVPRGGQLEFGKCSTARYLSCIAWRSTPQLWTYYINSLHTGTKHSCRGCQAGCHFPRLSALGDADHNYSSLIPLTLLPIPGLWVSVGSQTRPGKLACCLGILMR